MLALELAVSELQPTTAPIALLIVGVDRAASETAQENHDELLPTVAKLLRLVSGKSGVLGHIANGLFAVMRRGIEPRQALQLAESFRLAVEVNFKSRKHPITASVGVACCPAASTFGAADALALAEWSHIQARVGGGNRVRCDGLDAAQLGRFPPGPSNHLE